MEELYQTRPGSDRLLGWAVSKAREPFAALVAEVAPARLEVAVVEPGGRPLGSARLPCQGTRLNVITNAVGEAALGSGPVHAADGKIQG